MAAFASTGEHRPVFYHPEGKLPRSLTLSAEQKLEPFTPFPLFAGLFDRLFEKRPETTPDGKKKIRDVLVKDALIEHTEFYEVAPTTYIFQEGSFGEHLFLLLKGQIRTSTQITLDVDRHVVVPLEDLQEGDFFGEMSVLSMNAHLFSAQALTPTLLALVPQFIVQELTAAQESFRAIITQAYTRRAVQTLIRRIPLLRLCAEEEIAQLTAKASLRTFAAGAIIFEEEEPADSLYVTHQGFVKLSKRDSGKERILSYVVEGDCFGETGVLTDEPRSANAIAMSKTELLVIPGAEFRALVSTNPSAMDEAHALAHLRRLDIDMAENVTFIGARLERQAEVMPNLDVLAIDESICVRCDNCVKACAAAHEDGISRLIRKGTMVEDMLLPTACRFCQDPVCLLCKSGGIKRDKNGDIYFTDSCIGCSGCAQRCPYGNIIMVDTEEIARSSRPTLAQYLLNSLFQGRGAFSPAEEKRPRLKKIPVKCDLDKDHLFPACVSNCPTGAIKRYQASELDHLIAGQRKK